MKRLHNIHKITLFFCSIFLLLFAVTPVQSFANSDNSDLIMVPFNYNTSDQVVTLLNKSGKEVDISGFKIKDGSGNVFEFPADDSIIIEPFGIIRVHSGPGIEDEYSSELDFRWTKESIWGEAKIARLADPSGEVIFELDLSTTGNKDLLAGCLTRKEIKMYGFVSCTYCQAQLDKFENSSRYVNYVECTENQKICIEERIMRVPAWVFEEKDKRTIGSMSLGRLYRLAGCNFGP